MRQMTGKQSISFAKAVYIEGSAAIVGEKEKDGPLGEYFSHTLSDPMCGQEAGRRARVNCSLPPRSWQCRKPM